MKLRAIKFPSSGYRSPLLSYWPLAVVAVLTVFLVMREGIGESPDTATYYAAGDKLSSGIVDMCRTPVYPAVLYLCKQLFGYDGSKIAVVVLQAIVYLLSIVYFNKSIRLILPKYSRTSFWITVLYVLFILQRPSDWVRMILTESFAISWTVFLTYCMIRSVQARTALRHAAYTSIWLVLLVFLRPALICYIPVVAIFWIMLWVHKRREAIKPAIIGLAGVAVTVILVGIYSTMICNTYGIHSISYISVTNNYANLRYYGLITPDDTDDTAFKEFLEQRIAKKDKNLTAEELWKEMAERTQLISPVSVEKAVNHAMRTKTMDVVKATYIRFRQVGGQYPMVLYQYALTFAFIMILVVSYRERKLLIVPTMLILIVASTLATMYVGTFAEWGRILSPIIPTIALLFGWCCKHLRVEPPTKLSGNQ